MNQSGQSSGHGGPKAYSRSGQRNDGRSPPPAIDVSDVKFTSPVAPALFDDIARSKAETVAAAREETNKPSQLRRFYDELVMWQEKVGSDEARFSELEPFIRMLKAKVAYAKGRKHVDDNFAALFSRVVDQASDPTRLRMAKLFMEAFLAFYKGLRDNK